jgi:hypothetical protein
VPRGHPARRSTTATGHGTGKHRAAGNSSTPKAGFRGRSKTRHLAQQGTQVQRVPTDAPPPSPCLAHGRVSMDHSGQKSVARHPTSHHAVVKAKARPHSNGHGSLHTSSADSLQQLSRPPCPGPLWFLLPTPPSATAAEAPRPQSPSAARPHQACRSTQRQLRAAAQKRSMAVAPVTPHMACAAIAGHRIGDDLIARCRPLFMQCSSQSRYHRRLSPSRAPSQDLTGHAGAGTG